MTKVFWADGCGPCRQTKMFLDREGIPYEAIKVESMEELPEGYMQIPVVVSHKGTWTGFSASKLRELKNG